MKENIKYKIAEFFSPKIYWLKEMFGRKKGKHIKKQSKLSKMVYLGLIQVRSASHVEVGVKVLTRNGIGHIKKFSNNRWAVISYNSGSWTKDVPIKELFQYYFSVTNTFNDTITQHPLAYSDYEYIHPEWDNNKWLEGIITNLKYFKLTDQEKEKYQHLPTFTKTQEGRHILEKLEGKEIDLEFEDKYLVTIKK